MREIRWDFLKNTRLKRTRGASFEDLLSSRLIAVKHHPGKTHQSLMLFEHKHYVWIVPFVEERDHVFLKTLYPS